MRKIKRITNPKIIIIFLIVIINIVQIAIVIITIALFVDIKGAIMA